MARAFAGPVGNNDRPCLTLKVLYGLPLRQTTGLMDCLIRMAGLYEPVSDYSTP